MLSGDEFWHVVIKVRGHPNSTLAQFPGAYVAALTLADSESQAKAHIEVAAREQLDADVISFDSVARGDPDEWDVHDDKQLGRMIEDDNIPKLSGVGVRQEFHNAGDVIFGTPLTWKPKRWWQIWR